MSFTDAMSGCGIALTGCLGSLLVLALSLVGLGLGIASIIIGVKWKDCYLNDDDAPLFLILFGSLSLGAIVSSYYVYELKKKGHNPGLSGLIAALCSAGDAGVLIWGLTIFWDTEQGDCNAGQYDFGYYMPHVLVFMVTAIFAMIVVVALTMGCWYMWKA